MVRAKDTPGFIANRIGGMWLQAAVGAAMDLGLTVEEADAIMGRPFGMPRTGVFGLLDLVGIDLMPQVGLVEHATHLARGTTPTSASTASRPLITRKT